MRVLIISCVFPPESVMSSQTSAQVAEELAVRGHTVTVITAFPSRPGGRPYRGYSRKIFQLERIHNGIQILRCFSLFSSDSSMVSRFLENISFGLTGGLATLFSQKPDVIYVNTWPIFAAAILFLVAKIRHIPLVISIQDLYPESLISQKRTKPNGCLVRWMRWLDGIVARGSCAVIPISDNFAVIYRNERGVPSDRIYVVPNWVNTRSTGTFDKRTNSFRASRNIPQEAFLLLYGGNIGVAADVETIIESFRHLKEIENLYLVVAGEGSRLKDCQVLAREIGCPRIIFHSPWPKHETSVLLNAADVLILPTRHNQSLVSMPSKLISYMLAARPVIAMALAQSDLSKLIERSGCGWVVEPDHSEMLATKIRQIWAMDPDKLKRRGEAGREFALANFTREACLPKIISILEQAFHYDQ